MSREGPGPVPDRWLNCPRKSDTLIAGKFLAFKTPLKAAFNDQIPLKYRFHPSMLFESTKSKKWRIGMWIDLTNTERFYDSSEIKKGYRDEREVSYMKLACKGHGEAPSRDVTDEFIRMCSNFSKIHPLDIIGVHCTHGFNRTGFLIVSYLVEEEDRDLRTAIHEFATARYPGIYKQDYINELFRRYDDVNDALRAPLKPNWKIEGDMDYDDDEEEEEEHEDSNSVSTKANGKRSKNENGKKKKFKDNSSAQFMEGIKNVTAVSDESVVMAVRIKVKEMCGYNRSGFPGSQPVSMNLENIRKLTEKPYRVSWKADGTRYMMLIENENQVYFIDRDNCVFIVSGLKFLNRDLKTHMIDTLLDGEMVIDKHEGRNIPRYLIYDIICCNRVSMVRAKFYPDRLKAIEAAVVGPRNTAIGHGIIDRNREPFSVRAKPFLGIEHARGYLSEKFAKQLTHEPDGLIFQPSEDFYVPDQCPEVLKWKPPSLNSVDFKMKITVQAGAGLLKQNICELYVGGLDRPFAYMKYTKEMKMYDKKIIECKMEGGNWVFMRERTDKSFPNSFKTAQAVCESIKRPVTKEILLNLIDTEGYGIDRIRMPPPSVRR